jgi:hypothetical protein
MKLFYAALLFFTRFELARAKAAPIRNQRHIEALQRDESNYESALIRLEFGL